MIRILLTTFASEDAAALVVRTLVEERLAACGTILPGARSIYRWNGEIEDASETLVLLKTTAASSAALEARLRELHPYEVPEVVLFDPASAGSAYSQWLEDCCRPVC